MLLLKSPLKANPILLRGVSEKRGLGAFVFTSPGDHHFPDYALRRKIERQVAKSVHEHLIIYIDTMQTTQVWQWVKREPGNPLPAGSIRIIVVRPGESLIQKLQNIVFSLEEEERPYPSGRDRPYPRGL